MTDLIPASGSATVSVDRAAEILGISRSTAYELIRRDEFPVPVIRLGKRRVVSIVMLERLLAGEAR